MRGRYRLEVQHGPPDGQTVRDVMSPHVVAGTGDEPLATIAARMTAECVGAVAVLEGGLLAGIITERDVVRAVGEGRDPRHTRAADCMTKRPMTVRAADNLSSAIRLMRAMGVRHLPVVEDGRPVGFLSLRDVLRVAPDGAGARRA